MEELEKINKKSTIISKTLFFILLITFFAQFSFFTNAISQTVEIWPIVYSKDNDAANGIRVAQVSGWSTNNKFFAYGNVYFRIANTLSKINPLDKSSAENYQFSEESDKVTHFSLMFISLLSIYGMSFLLSFLITKDINQILVSMIIINTVFMSNGYWMSKVFGVHPDILLCFLTSLALFSSIKLLSFFNKDTLINAKNKNEIKDLLLIIFSITWGLTLSVKLSSLFFIPALLLLFLPVTKINIKEKVIDFVKFITFTLTTYFVVGFPQNFDIVSTYNFMVYQNGFSTSPTLASFNEWWLLLYKQYIIFLPVLFFLTLVFSDTKKSFYNILKLFIIVFIPFCFLLSRNVTSPHEHYTLPIAISLLVFTTQILINLKVYVTDKKMIASTINSNIFVSISLVIAILMMIYIPNSVLKEYDKNLICKDESKVLYNLVKSFQIRRFKVEVDPYVPFSQALGSVRNKWFKTFDDIAPTKTDVLVLSKKYYSRYTLSKESSHYIAQDTNNFDNVKAFYILFDNKNKAKDKYGQEWQKIYSDSCDWEIWERTELIKK